VTSVAQSRVLSSPRGSKGTRDASITWMTFPAFGLFLAFGIIPVLGVLALSFTTWDGIGAIVPSGLDSWVDVLTDPALPNSILVTFEIMVFGWLAQTPLAILLGTFMAGNQRYREVFAVLYFVPLLLSAAAVAITFKALLDPNFGLGPALGLDFLSQDWLGQPVLALITVIAIGSWQYIPFHALIYQGGVRQIPVSMYEAATLDGAGRVRQFFYITLPQLKYTIITSSTLMIIGGLTSFDLIFVLTAGGPGDATETLALAMYQQGFKANLMGPASAIAVILVLVGLGIALLLQRLGGKSGESQLEGA
jgi:raffinose/stachyose/melibiose transport system permease protein